MDLQTRINAFVAKADEVTAEHWKRMDFKHTSPPTHRAHYISDKWARVVVVEGDRETSVFCFICLKDNFTKALGAVQRGDIHKAASFKAPAKHARGNVFNDDFNNCITPHGVVYLK